MTGASCTSPQISADAPRWPPAACVCANLHIRSAHAGSLAPGVNSLLPHVSAFNAESRLVDQPASLKSELHTFNTFTVNQAVDKKLSETLNKVFV